MHSYLDDVIKNMTEGEQALGESLKFAAILQHARSSKRFGHSFALRMRVAQDISKEID